MHPKSQHSWVVLLISLLTLCWAAVSTAAQNAPSQNALSQAKHWRQVLLKQGGAGLYASVELTQLAKQAGLTSDSAKHLAELDDLLIAVRPRRVRLYRVTEDDQSYWVARLNYQGSRLNFLRLKTNTKGQLVDWYDYSLGIWLSQLLVESQALHKTQMAVMTHQLAEHPMRLLDTVSPSSAIARLIIPACQQLHCYRQALKALPVKPDEVSLFALDKASLNEKTVRVQTEMQYLKRQLGKDPAVTWLLATTAIQANRCDKAISIVEPALTQWPAAIRLYPLASQCYMALKAPQKALDALLAMQRETGVKIDWNALLNKAPYQPLRALITE